MESKERRDVVFDPQDFALMCEAVQKVHEHYDDMTPAMTIDLAREDVRALHDRIAATEPDPRGVVLPLTYRDMIELYGIVWWAAEWYESLSFPPEISEQALDELCERLIALQDRTFPEFADVKPPFKTD